jgi:hypothetical protein
VLAVADFVAADAYRPTVPIAVEPLIQSNFHQL